MSEEQAREEFFKNVSNAFQQQNQAGMEDFLGLSPNQMGPLLRSPLEENCVVQFAEEISEADAQASAFMRALDHYLAQLVSKPIKLTAKGNLPRAAVLDLHAIYDELSQKPEPAPGLEIKVRGEDDFPMATAIKYLSGKAGWTKKRSGKISLTKKGEKIRAAPAAERLRTIFPLAFKVYNLEYVANAWGFDDEAPNGILQQFTGFVLYQFLVNGKDWRPVEAYHQELITAFPLVMRDFHDRSFLSAQRLLGITYDHTFTDTLMDWFGLARQRGGGFGPNATPKEAMATDLFRRLFRLVPDAMRPDNVDVQLASALFDAEMGSQSWVSNDMPVELQQQFHDKIRAFHAEGGAGRTTVGAVMEGYPTKAPAEVQEGPEALRLVQELMQELQNRHVLFPPPMLDPPTLYRFIVEDLYAHEIMPPTAEAPVLVSFADVESDIEGHPSSVYHAEEFILNLLHLEAELDASLYHSTMRLGDRVVPRAEGLQKARKWRAGLQKVVPISFAPGPQEYGDDGTIFQLVGLEYEATDRRGRTQTYKDAGVVQLFSDEQGHLLVVGAMLPGFEF